MRQQFGGKWTEAKLNVLEDYLAAYMTIMRGNAKARHFTTIYLDGFAGSGRRYARTDLSTQGVLEGFDDVETVEFYKGSVRRALELSKPFDRYIFVENDREAVAELKALASEFSDRRVCVEKTDANAFIPKWCATLGAFDRALVFLDPCGMQVEWSTVQALGATQKVDLWVLVPLGQAIIRLLTERQPPQAWASSLSRFFGTDAWREEFYPVEVANTLFGSVQGAKRDVDYKRVTAFFVERLKTAFCGVLDTPVVLRNSKGVPLYVLFFAASNPNGAPTALKIARDIARGFNDGG